MQKHAEKLDKKNPPRTEQVYLQFEFAVMLSVRSVSYTCRDMEKCFGKASGLMKFSNFLHYFRVERKSCTCIKAWGFRRFSMQIKCTIDEPNNYPENTVSFN